MEMRRTTKEQVAGLRAAKQRETDLSIVPGFYVGLAAEAEPFLIVEAPAPGAVGPASAVKETGMAETVLGYALLLGREHDGHAHTTLVELGLGEGHRDRYEDVLDLIRDEAKPAAYLVRTDDCRLNATLLSRGLQVEATALVLVPEESRTGGRRRRGGRGARRRAGRRARRCIGYRGPRTGAAPPIACGGHRGTAPPR